MDLEGIVNFSVNYYIRSMIIDMNTNMNSNMNSRAEEIFQYIVECYMESGEPVGSRTISKNISTQLSPATIRNVMADLEDMGLLFSPHTSAGRLPTQQGLRIFVDAYLDSGMISEAEQTRLETQFQSHEKSVHSVIEQTSKALSGLCSCASLVVSPKREEPLEHIEFVYLAPGKALAVLVMRHGHIENRIMDIAPETTPDMLQVAGAFLKERLYGKTLADMRKVILQEIAERRSELSELTARVVESGIAIQPSTNRDYLVVQGHSNLVDESMMADLERIQELFGILEEQETATQILDQMSDADGVQIFIGSENKIFQHNELSLVLSSYQNGQGLVGAIGVIGPTRLNYKRVVPIVSYTSELMSRMLSRNITE